MTTWIRHFARRSIPLLLVVAAACGNGPDRGGPAGDFRLESLARDRFYLHRHRGKVVMLVFWATDCRECLKELGALKNLRQRWALSHLTIATVCTDPHNITDLRQIVSDLDIGLPVLLDHRAKLKHRFGLRGVPSTVLIGRDGRTASVQYGYSPSLFKKLQTQVTVLLETEASS